MLRLFFSLILFFIIVVRIESAQNSFITYALPDTDSNNEIQTSDIEFVWGTFSQKLDHFNASSTKYFKQRYLFTNNTKSKINGDDAPIFLMVGGQNEIQETVLWNNYPADIARSLNGFVFVLEHRYYGESIPVDDLSLENLQWLNIEQSLADISIFIDFIRHRVVHNSRSKIILVGGRYGGTLAVWFQQLYPGKASGIWASSAPLLAKVDNEDALKITGQVIKQIGGDNCYERIQRGIKIGEMLHANGSFNELEKEFALCNVSNENHDIRYFFSTIATMLSRMIEFGTRNEILSFCKALNMNPIDAALSIFVRQLFKNEKTNCLSLDRQAFVDFLQKEKLTDLAVVSGARQAIYQDCSGFGWFSSTSAQNQPFGESVPVELFYESCLLAFGNDFNRGRINERTETINAIFGGLDPAVNRVLYTNGEMDPWRMLSIQTEYNRNCIVLNIEGEGSSSDLNSISDLDSPQLASAKTKIKSIINDFLNK